MNPKIQKYHREKPAYIYLRQSTMGQVRYHRESTERQYALRDRAIQLGWHPEKITTLDRDLGISGTQYTTRLDFKTLVADVSMNKVGAVFALEASRLSRSNTDWHRLLELCSLTSTLIIDEDGCYDPSDFNDQLLLGLKGTMSQAELHFIRARLQGGKVNKARKGTLRFPLPVGFCYNNDGEIIQDADSEVRHVVYLLFKAFKETGSAFGVVQYFFRNKIKFPKRAYGGIWNGKLIWDTLTHGRVIGVLKNPSYAGCYVYGRYKYKKVLSGAGQISSKVESVPMSSWQVDIKDHHEAYLTWEEYLENLRKLRKNRTNGPETLVPMAAREGIALLQGLMLCSICGRRLSVRYTGNGGKYPCYQCTWRKRDGLSSNYCMSIRCNLIDEVISARVLEIIRPEQIKIAIKAFEEVERRNTDIDKHWQMRIERIKYDSELAQRRYEEVDPSNRLVAATLEKRWNDALVNLREIQDEYLKHRERHVIKLDSEKKEKVLALAKDLPRLWKMPTTTEKDKKRILRLLIKDITVEMLKKEKKMVLHIRWQGGAVEDIQLEIPQSAPDKWRHSESIVKRVRQLAKNLMDEQIAEIFSKEGLKTNKGNMYTVDSIKWIRYKHCIPSPLLKRLANEFTVHDIMEKFDVSKNVVYYWINKKVLRGRQVKKGSPYYIKIGTEVEKKLNEWIENSQRIPKEIIGKRIEVGAI